MRRSKNQKKLKGKGLSSNVVQKQKIISTLLKMGMSDEEILHAFASYNIERQVFYKNGKKMKRVIMLPKTMSQEEGIREAIYVSLP
jgi:hypothetical protein